MSDVKTTIGMSTRELAERWNMSEATLRAWRFRGFGPPFIRPSGRKSGSVRYRLSDIEEWERKNTTGQE